MEVVVNNNDVMEVVVNNDDVMEVVNNSVIKTKQFISNNNILINNKNTNIINMNQKDKLQENIIFQKYLNLDLDLDEHIDTNNINNIIIHDIQPTNPTKPTNPTNPTKPTKLTKSLIPKVTFSNEQFNNIRTFDDFNNMDGKNVDSINSGSSSNFSYTQIARKNSLASLLSPTKHMRALETKEHKKKKEHEIDEIDYLYNKLQNYIRYCVIDSSNYIILIIKAMEIIEHYKNNNNDFNNNNNKTKKDIVTKALNRIIHIDLNLSEYAQHLFLASISNIIDLIIINTKKVNSIIETNKRDNKYKKDNKYNKQNSRTNSSTNNSTNNNTNAYINNLINLDEDLEDILLANCGQIIHSMSDKLTTIILKKQYNYEKLFVNIGTIIELLMGLVDKFTYLIGTEKKLIIMQSIDKFIKTRLEFIIVLTPENKQMLIKTLVSIPTIIDVFIGVQKGKYKINESLIISKYQSRKKKLNIFFCGSQQISDNEEDETEI